MRAADGSVVVVDGVTGSGKTEVYLRAIEDVLAAGRSACVLVPEVSLTPQTVGRFRSRFGDEVAVLHSRLAAGERYDQWDLVRTGAARIVVGARSALFAPFKDLGLIVIDEEHESSYKQASSPRYHARDVAARMARLTGATLVLGSASPSMEALARCESGRMDARGAPRARHRPAAAAGHRRGHDGRVRRRTPVDVLAPAGRGTARASPSAARRPSCSSTAEASLRFFCAASAASFPNAIPAPLR